MTKRALFSLGLSAVALAAAVAGQGYAADRDAAKAAASGARAATKALAKRDGVRAIRFAEEAVALQPRAAGHRLLLGQSYLQAGRFRSAAAAFADVLTLDPANDRAALNLALARVAIGDWQGARSTLDMHSGSIAPADRGLAMALAGDPVGAVGVLMDAARAPGATAKVRQNLALAFALAGQWQAARAAASADMSPADVDQRMVQWAAFAQPRSAADQVAALLGVEVASDPGQPQQIALTRVPVVVPQSAAPVAVAAAPIAEAGNAMAAVASPSPAMAGIVFGPRREVVQPLPAPLIRASTMTARLALSRAATTSRVQPIPADVSASRLGATSTRGSWYVQLGAYENAAVARDAWNRITRRHGMADRVPNGATILSGSDSFYRLSVGGYARADADRLCRTMRTRGGACFVRAGAGDRIAAWVSGRTQLASRVSRGPA